jgi:hypothetical protein
MDLTCSVFVLHTLYMAEKTVVLNIRVSEPQARWLRKLAERQHSGNLSAAARQTLTDSWVLRRCRDEYQDLRGEGFLFPRDEIGATRPIEFFLSSFGANSEMRWEDQDAEWD